MALSTERLKVASDILCAALQANALSLGGEPQQRAEEIAAAFKIIAKAVGEMAGQNTA